MRMNYGKVETERDFSNTYVFLNALGILVPAGRISSLVEL